MVVLGANDQNLRIIRSTSPSSTWWRGATPLKVIGPAGQVDLFLERFEQLSQHVARYNELPRKVLDDIMGGGKDGRRKKAARTRAACSCTATPDCA
jgi:hypothetical protein